MGIDSREVTDGYEVVLEHRMAAVDVPDSREATAAVADNYADGCSSPDLFERDAFASDVCSVSSAVLCSVDEDSPVSAYPVRCVLLSCLD